MDAYRAEVDRMAKRAAEGLKKDATDEAKLKALNTYFFEKRAFLRCCWGRGSRSTQSCRLRSSRCAERDPIRA